METKSISLVDRLKGVLEKNIDAQKGYAKAAENADSRFLQSFFQRKSMERQSFNTELQTELHSAYGTEKIDGSATGTLHRAWMDVKNLFSADSDESMLEECIRGDKAAIEEYTEILNNTALPISVSTILRNQVLKLRTDLNQVQSLEDLRE
ncbi:PA2169 family four-helix-bundle protein [Euzebyella marina]|uniref:PA2169 family four-helix-bundle protein n=1 Tax=Euzebyella marina TaxID=1761453 RepID=A0A3G2L7Z0_9FLAO|nr:PA2169 family four-helix-bundle protein [Euzebyella marina]AYN68379.1 PA2169 family four-helix-bundle protein [Euzebyella marina]MAU72778.1 hypothetical protein [Pseudozobellia sp.]MBG50565.1 hypothetical protein [Pseudozobellia sp.]|tara:strand:- start:19164 stop:19616 length:453 start_codon:yes stop_codon:yes gene_type:complete